MAPPPPPTSAEALRDDLIRARAAVRGLQRRSVNAADVRRTVSADPSIVQPLLAEADALRAARRVSAGSRRPSLAESRAASRRSAAAPGELVPPLAAPASDAAALYEMVTSTKLNCLLIAVPLGALAWAADWGPVPVFSLNFLALIPLALVLGQITEDLADRFGDTIGGLINATFGNVVEMILTIAALNKGLYSVVSMSLVGSILSNLLLVLGLCYFVGGIKYPEQRFSTLANKTYCSLLFMSCIALLVPTAASIVYGPALAPGAVLSISRAVAVILLAIYGAYLYFTLETHGDMVEADARASAALSRSRLPDVEEDRHAADGDGEGEEDDPGSTLSLVGALAALAAITACIATASEFLTSTIEEVTSRTGVSSSFIALVLLPIAGNACEHIVAVQVAAKRKMDLAASIACGSSLQIAALALPFAVVSAWIMGRPYTLVLDPYIALVLTLSVTHAYTASADGASNWLLGAQLVGTYVLVCLPFVYLKK